MADSSGISRTTAGMLSSPAGDDFVALLGALARNRTHDDRLHQALCLDRLRQILERILPHIDARLVLAALQQVDRDVPQTVARRLVVGAGCLLLGRRLAQQGVEAPAQSFLRCHS